MRVWKNLRILLRSYYAGTIGYWRIRKEIILIILGIRYQCGDVIAQNAESGRIESFIKGE